MHWKSQHHVRSNIKLNQIWFCIVRVFNLSILHELFSVYFSSKTGDFTEYIIVTRCIEYSFTWKSDGWWRLSNHRRYRRWMQRVFGWRCFTFTIMGSYSTACSCLIDFIFVSRCIFLFIILIQWISFSVRFLFPSFIER